MISITNKIQPSSHRQRLHDPDTVAVHRLSFSADPLNPVRDCDLTAGIVRAKFSETDRYRPGSYTGGLMPYTFLAHADGRVEQCVELRDSTPHASRWNGRTVGVGVVGDFRYYHAPTAEQLESLTELCCLLVQCGLRVFGHTELAGATSDPSKVCPGDRLDMAKVRSVAYGSVSRDGKRHELSWLVDQGIVL